jgi:serine/threonine protein kinase
VHRDIKPANILVDVNGTVKIADFGILAELANTQAKCKTFVGTALYMSPERIQSQEYSYASDVWSLGLTVHTHTHTHKHAHTRTHRQTHTHTHTHRLTHTHTAHDVCAGESAL